MIRTSIKLALWLIPKVLESYEKRYKKRLASLQCHAIKQPRSPVLFFIRALFGKVFHPNL